MVTHPSGDSVAMVTKKKVEKEEDTASVADSAFGTASVSGTVTGTQFSEVSWLMHTWTAVDTMYISISM